mgnify:CR=1 FL=1
MWTNFLDCQFKNFPGYNMIVDCWTSYYLGRAITVLYYLDAICCHCMCYFKYLIIFIFISLSMPRFDLHTICQTRVIIQFVWALYAIVHIIDCAFTHNIYVSIEDHGTNWMLWNMIFGLKTRYVWTWFALDVCSSIPFQAFALLFTGKLGRGLGYNLLNMLRLWRLRRVNSLFSR